MKKLFGSKEFVIGLSVIISLVVLFFGIDYLKGINMLRPSNFYYVEYEDVTGLAVASPVSINGFAVGKVRDIEYDYEHPGTFKVLLALEKKLRLPEDSYAELSSTLMGGGFVDIKLGKSPKAMEIGTTIPTRPHYGLMESLDKELMPAINSILPKVDSLMYSLNTLVSDPALAASIARIDGITTNLLYASQGLRSLNTQVPAVMNNAHSATVKIDSICANLAILSSELKQLPISNTMENVNNITTDLSKFSSQLNNPNSTLGRLTTDQELYNRLNTVASDIDSLIVDIKKNPKRYISIKLL